MYDILCCGLWAYIFNREYIINIGIVAMADMKYSQDGVFLMETTYKAEEIVSIPDALYNYDIRNDGAIGRKKTLEWYDKRYRLMLHRCRIRKITSETDMQRYYNMATNVFYGLQQVINLFIEMGYFKLFNNYVTHPDVKDSIYRVSIKNAPLEFAILVRLFNMYCYFVFSLLDSTENRISYA